MVRSLDTSLCIDIFHIINSVIFTPYLFSLTHYYSRILKPPISSPTTKPNQDLLLVIDTKLCIAYSRLFIIGLPKHRDIKIYDI